MPALHQTSIPRLHAQPPRNIAHQIPSSQAGPLRPTPVSDGPDPGLAPVPTGLPRLRPSAWSSAQAPASRPCHRGPRHTASWPITSLLSTGPCSRFDSDDSDVLPHSPRSPHERLASRPNSSCLSARRSILSCSSGRTTGVPPLRHGGVRPVGHLAVTDRPTGAAVHTGLWQAPRRRAPYGTSTAQVGRVNPNHPAALRLEILRGPIPRSSLTSSRVTRGRGGKLPCIYLH
jgi:hypothetical protein